MQTAALGILAAPVDLILSRRESELYRRSLPPQRPVILVAGAPRSGTTLVSQLLIRHLPVAWIDNLSAVFPRSPLTAARLARLKHDRLRVEPRSYYGKSLRFAGPNDGLHIWDRWFGTDRTMVPEALDPVKAEEMRAFFGALESAHGLPVLNKNNSLNLSAHLVAEALPTARFLCLVRDPLYLAQSLYMARLEIHGDPSVPYGIPAPGPPGDIIEDVCRQALYHERVATEQQGRIGSDRYWVVSYEDFCADPAALVAAVSEGILGLPADTGRLAAVMPELRASKTIRTTREVFQALADALDRLRRESRSS